MYHSGKVMKRSDLVKMLANEAVSEVIKCQTEINYMDNQAYSDKIQVVKRNNHLKQPLFDKRDKLLLGVKNFWLRALQNHHTSFFIVDEGQNCLDYLHNLTIHDEEVLSYYTYTISFQFNENPYFYNQVLWKKFTISVQGERSLTMCKIQWKEGFEPDGRNDVNKSRKRKRPMSSGFINWFISTDNYLNVVIADELRNDLWQNPLTYYNMGNLVDSFSNTGLTEYNPEEMISRLRSGDQMDVDDSLEPLLVQEPADHSYESK